MSKKKNNGGARPRSRKKPDKRPKQIWRKSCRIFESKIPEDWACRDQQDQEDTGIDYELEPYTKEDIGNGLIFKAQVKGEIEVAYKKSSYYVLNGLETDKLDYFLNKLRIPVVLILVDLKTEKVWWYGLSADVAAQDTLRKAKKNSKKTTSIRFSPDHLFPDSQDGLLEYVTKARIRIGVLDLASVTLETISNFVPHSEKEEVLRALGDNVANQELDYLFELIERGDLQKAKLLAESILVNPLRKWAIKFDAAFAIEKSELSEKANSPSGSELGFLTACEQRLANNLIAVAKERSIPLAARQFAVLINRIANLNTEIEQLMAYSLSVLALEKGPLKVHALPQRIRYKISLRRCLDKLQKTLMLVTRLAYSDEYSFWVEGIIRMGKCYQDLALALSTIGMDTSARDVSGQGCELMLKAFNYYSRIGLKERAALAALLIPNIRASASLSDLSQARIETESLIDGLNEPDLSMRSKETLTLMTSQLTAVREVENHGQMDPQEEEKIVWFLAKQQGYLNGPHKEAVQDVIEKGFRDRNPERVLRDCIHRNVVWGTVSDIGARIGLRTIGTKLMICKKLNIREEGSWLDDLESKFTKKHCSSCPHKHSHPQQWRWDREWQDKQDSR